MYRIELSPGEETAFRSIEELAVAIRRKVVTPRARIWHNASNKWLPIQFHPHYKLAVSMPLTQADLVAGPPVAPLSVLKLGEPTTPPVAPVPTSSREAATQAALTAWPAPKPPAAPAAKAAAPPPARAPHASETGITLGTPAPEPRAATPRAPEPRRTVQPARIEPPRAEPSRVVEPSRPSKSRTKGSRKAKKSGRTLHLALGGAVIAACAQLIISTAARPGSELAERMRTPRRFIETPIEAMQEDSPRTVAGVLPALQTIPLPRRSASSSNPLQKRGPVASPAIAPEPGQDTLEARSDVMGATVDSASTPEIQPAPPAGDLSASVHAAPAPLTPKGVDSTGRKALKGLLRTIGGTPAPESKTPKR
ncbi:MAG: hypothetical protein ABI703_02505 [Gemmatimonadales bacterium]